MEHERWLKIETLYHSALEREESARPEFLRLACAGDESLRREVESLLAEEERGSFLGKPALEVAALALAQDQAGLANTAAPDAMVGRIVSHYRILDKLGSGGMGVVYRARDQRLERDVAVKVLPPGSLADEQARKRFRKEALALAKLNHPNIAAVYDVGDQNGLDYLVMEYVDGDSLAEKLRAGPLAAQQAVSFAGQLASALEEAHERGVVHRDLKPGNIVITRKGHAKVLDFGLAKLLARGDGEEATRSFAETGGPVGTPLYMSPEQAEGKAIDWRTDLWSLGVVLYESLAGMAPFQGESGWAVLRAIAEENPKPLREIRPDAPVEVDRIVSRALKKDLSRRYQSAAEMARDLSEVLAQLSGPTPAARREVRIPRPYAAAAALLLVLLVAFGGWFYHRSERRRWAREEAIPNIAKLIDDDKPLAAFELLQQVKRYLPAESQLAQIAEENTSPVSITSSPAGATVEIQDYVSPGSSWYRLGTTPLKDLRIPNGYFRWRVSKAGLAQYVAAPPTGQQMSFALDAAAGAPPGMVWVRGGAWGDMIDFIGWLGPYDLAPYYIDRFEVTNRQFQDFIDRRGYEDRQYWKEKFIRNGQELSWNDAVVLFRDSTGRPGPSTWEGGHFPEGQADYPVSGVSWYEASAYAAFAGKSLPVLAQWFQVAPPEVATSAVRVSNISRTAPAPVGRFIGLGPYGTYDMAGNVREWVENAAGDEHFILGGAWNSPTYLAADPEALPAFDRSPANGFRCVRNTAPVPRAAAEPANRIARDFSTAKPVSNEVFRAYREMYEYDKGPLNAKPEGVVEDTADWREEKITFDAAYGNERVIAYLFLPKHVIPPYQTVVFFPSARVLDLADSRALGDIKFFDYVAESGRAVLYPIYQGTYERQKKLFLPGDSHEVELITERFKDLGRSLDYLETRTEIDKNKLAYLGVSMGSAEGVIYAALAQDRLRTAVFLDGGFFLGMFPPSIDQVNFAPRLKKPVLMVNGRYDYTFSVEKAQIPLFRMLGTPEADKKHVVLESPHDVTQRRTELVREVLGWFDRYMGRVG